MKLTIGALRRIIKEEVSKAHGRLAEGLGQKYAYTNAKYPKLGTIEGTLFEEDGPFGALFLPDEEYHDLVYSVTGQEPEQGLFVDKPGVKVTPIM